MNSIYNTNRQINGTSNITDAFSGFAALSEQLEYYMQGAENSTEILMEGAEAFLNDFGKLSKPMSAIRRSGYTHLINSGAIEKKDKEVVVGWGKYYGRMVELGTEKMNARPHMYLLWERNKEKYYKLMLTRLGMKTW